MDPSQTTLLLVGPKVHRMAPILGARGFQVTPCPHGKQGLYALARGMFHVVVLELELDDLDTRAFLDEARVLAPHTGFLLLDDPSRTHLIVATFARGLDAYVPTPPDEASLLATLCLQALYAEVRRQGGIDAMRTQSAALAQHVAQLQLELTAARKESAHLAEQVRTLSVALEKARAEAKAAREEGELLMTVEDDDGDGEELLILEDSPPTAPPPRTPPPPPGAAEVAYDLDVDLDEDEHEDGASSAEGDSARFPLSSFDDDGAKTTVVPALSFPREAAAEPFPFEVHEVSATHFEELPDTDVVPALDAERDEG